MKPPIHPSLLLCATGIVALGFSSCRDRTTTTDPVGDPAPATAPGTTAPGTTAPGTTTPGTGTGTPAAPSY
jgi:hypothetical protein